MGVHHEKDEVSRIDALRYLTLDFRGQIIDIFITDTAFSDNSSLTAAQHVSFVAFIEATTTTSVSTTTTIPTTTTTAPATTTTTAVSSCVDNDHDGWGVGPGCAKVDCDDTDSSINPGAQEVCGDGIDNNCNDEIDEGCDTGCPAAQLMGEASPEIKALRHFRDTTLAGNRAGRALISLYYRNAGAMRRAFEQSPALRSLALGCIKRIAPLLAPEKR